MIFGAVAVLSSAMFDHDTHGWLRNTKTRAFFSFNKRLDTTLRICAACAVPNGMFKVTTCSSENSALTSSGGDVTVARGGATVRAAPALLAATFANERLMREGTRGRSID